MRRPAAVLLLAAALVAGTGPAALAEAPERTGWWSAASSGGLVVPQPTTAEGDLRVTRSLRTEAYAAVLVRAEGATAVELTLGLRAGRTVGVPDVVACPTATTDWPAGGNQAADKGPAVDCGALSLATTAEDGSLVFGLDAVQQAEPGLWSIALVPQPGGATPFTVDLVLPEGGGVTVVQTSAADDLGTPAEEPATEEPATGTAQEPGGFTADATDPVLDVPAPSGEGVAVNPLLAEALPPPAAAEDGEPPIVDLQVAPPGGAATPRLAAAQDAAGLDGPRLLAVLALVGVAYLLGRAQGEQRPGPRLLGGRARVAQPTAPVAAAAAEPAERPRGIGRFAKQRDRAPRRLR